MTIFDNIIYNNDKEVLFLDSELIGKKVKELRINAGYSQSELAEGICTQAQISKIEKGKVYPMANTLFHISEKVGVDPNYFFDIGTTPKLDEIQKVKQNISFLKRNMRYKQIDKILQKELLNPLFRENSINYQYLLWHVGVVQCEVQREPEEAKRTMEKAFKLTPVDKIWSEQQIEIALSIGSVNNTMGEYEKALDLYKLIKEEINKKALIKNSRIHSRYCYEIARVYTRLKEYEQSIKHCEEGIDYCIQEQSQAFFGEFHYQIGYNYELMKMWPAANKFYREAISIFRHHRVTMYDPFLKEKLKLVKSNLSLKYT